MVNDSFFIDIISLAEFLLEKPYRLLDEPYRGEILLIYELFAKDTRNDWNKKVQGFETFIELLKVFNECSAYSLEIIPELAIIDFDLVASYNAPKIVRINSMKIKLLKTKLKGKTLRSDKNIVSQIENNKGLKSLGEILSGPFLTRINNESEIGEYHANVDISLLRLERVLKTETACTQLSREKLKQISYFKKYFDICENKSHSQILSKVIFSKVEFARQNALDIYTAHKILYQNRNTILPEIYKCSNSCIHFLPIVNRNTDLSLGDCSYLDTCHKMKSCRYLHYFTLNPLIEENEGQKVAMEKSASLYTLGDSFVENMRKPLPPQWMNCDVRYLPFEVLGKFAVIISDPAWDIHMSLPYGTCKDFELLSLPMNELQEEGLILLWVTGRSIEIGRQALQNWGYSISNEMIWIKLNQLKRTIVTGRTGHWLNHSKEHLLVGIKGNPSWLHRLADTDLIVSSTRETLRKPDEVYDIVERIVGKSSRKLEIFGRDHNVRPSWLRNQLLGTSVVEEEILKRCKELNYPL